MSRLRPQAFILLIGLKPAAFFASLTNLLGWMVSQGWRYNIVELTNPTIILHMLDEKYNICGSNETKNNILYLNERHDFNAILWP